MIEAHLAEPVQTERLHLAFGDERRRAWLFQQHVVDDERQTETGYDLTITWSDRQKNKFRSI